MTSPKWTQVYRSTVHNMTSVPVNSYVATSMACAGLKRGMVAVSLSAENAGAVLSVWGRTSDQGDDSSNAAWVLLRRIHEVDFTLVGLQDYTGASTADPFSQGASIAAGESPGAAAATTFFAEIPIMDDMRLSLTGTVAAGTLVTGFIFG